MKKQKFKTENSVVYTDEEISNEIGREFTQSSKKSKLVERNKDDVPKNKSGERENFYALNTKAVDKLVNAEDYVARGEIAPDVDKYSKGRKPLPNWFKALFVKFWFSGAVCYFIFWGLSLFVSNMLDLAFVAGIVLGLIIDLLINNTLRFIAAEKEFDYWMLIPLKKFWTLFVHLVYGIVLMLLIIGIYDGINKLLILWQGLDPSSVPLGVEPLFFGIAFTICDLAFIGIKDLIVYFVKKARLKEKNLDD